MVNLGGVTIVCLNFLEGKIHEVEWGVGSRRGRELKKNKIKI